MQAEYYMTERLTLAQQHLYTFRMCQRRFFLRFLSHTPWPEAPLESELETAYDRGRRFHRWVERYFLGLPIQAQAADDATMRAWWSAFEQEGPSIPAGERFVEFGLTVPIQRHFLTGRFDLLVVSNDNGIQPYAHIFDWKTGEPRTIERLRKAWQTRVYLAVLAEGGPALSKIRPQTLAADHLTFTYWYVEDPQQPRFIQYDQAQHNNNWAELESIVEEIDRQLIENNWPLTDDWEECRQCAYQAHCGRQTAGDDLMLIVDEDELGDNDDWLEPQWG
jgi:hypothetical protein